MIYEFRRYECLPFKLPVLQNMMEHMAVPAFERNGAKVAGAWTTAVGDRDNTLIYMLGFNSMNDRMASWAAFHQDPLWIKQKQEVLAKEGALTQQIINSFLIPERYSPLK